MYLNLVKLGEMIECFVDAGFIFLTVVSTF